MPLATRPAAQPIIIALYNAGSEDYSGIIPDLWPQVGAAAGLTLTGPALLPPPRGLPPKHY